MANERIRQIEEFVKSTMDAAGVPDLMIAHDFKHVDRVRRWALRIAGNEGYPDLDHVEAATLLHDIGLACVERRGHHAKAGADAAAAFLRGRDLFAEQEIEIIADAIRAHSSPDGGGALGLIVRDADKLDALGAVGLMRGFTSKHMLPEYDPGLVRGETWELPMAGFEARFSAGQGIGDYIVDQLNFQISFYGDLKTETARRLGKPLVEFMRSFMMQLDSEIDHT
jgi:uncharacterized protein